MSDTDETLHFRSERLGDAPLIFAVHQAAFPTILEAELVDSLRTAGRLKHSLVAVSAERVVGHLALSPVSVAGQVVGLGLAPVAVLPEFQGRGVGGRLVRAGLDAAQEAGTGLVVVLGDPAYYGRFGFEPASRWQLTDDYGGGDAFQAIELAGGGVPAGGGRVNYAPEFAVFE